MTVLHANLIEEALLSRMPARVLPSGAAVIVTGFVSRI